MKVKASTSINLVKLHCPGRLSGKKDNEVLIKVDAAGICGSDIGAFRGTNPLGNLSANYWT